jgi:hypothetical protein
MFDMSMRPSTTNPGRTYKFYTGQPVYEFGYGLSYTTFSYAWYNDTTTASHSIESLMKITYETRHVAKQLFRVNVTNRGSMNGDDVVLTYIVPPQVERDGVTPPIKQLFGFNRVNLNVGETKHPGEYHIMIGNQRMFAVELHGQPTLWQRFR